MVRKANGQGNLYYNAQRKRYEVKVFVGGRRRTVTGKTQAQAWEKADALRRQEEGAPDLPPGLTVAQYLTHWTDDLLPHTDRRSSTVAQYKRMVDHYIEPRVGRVKLGELAPKHVERMLSGMAADGLSPNTQRQARNVLRSALRRAERDGLVTRNAAALAEPPRVTQREGRTLTPEQARKLLSAAEGTEVETLVHVLLSLGLRRGEALGLCWSDLDLERSPATLTVRRALKYGDRYSVVLEEPKTKGSRRLLFLPHPTAEALRRHRERQAKQAAEFGPDWGGKWAAEGFVFTTPIGTPLDPRNTSRELKALCERAGIGDWTTHELRHSAGSLLLAQGVSLKVISETLGHSSIRVTADVYAHLLEPAKVEAAEAMSRALYD